MTRLAIDVASAAGPMRSAAPTPPPAGPVVCKERPKRSFAETPAIGSATGVQSRQSVSVVVVTPRTSATAPDFVARWSWVDAQQHAETRTPSVTPARIGVPVADETRSAASPATANSSGKGVLAHAYSGCRR